MKIKDLKQAQPISDFSIKENHIYYFLGNDRDKHLRFMNSDLKIPERAARALVFLNPLQGLQNWSLMVFDGYDQNLLSKALAYRPQEVFNCLEDMQADTGGLDGNITTPLEKAVVQLMKIGSTNRAELEQMATHFITERGACKKLNIDYWKYSRTKIKEQVQALFMNGVKSIVLKITQEFFDNSEYKNLQLLGAFFNCKVVIDNEVSDYKLEGEQDA